jgi:hypothetical protein
MMYRVSSFRCGCLRLPRMAGVCNIILEEYYKGTIFRPRRNARFECVKKFSHNEGFLIVLDTSDTS